MSKDTFRSTVEAMTAEDISHAQNEHYMLDDQIRQMSTKLTADQKRKLVDMASSMMKTGV